MHIYLTRAWDLGNDSQWNWVFSYVALSRIVPIPTKVINSNRETTSIWVVCHHSGNPGVVALKWLKDGHSPWKGALFDIAAKLSDPQEWQAFLHFYVACHPFKISWESRRDFLLDKTNPLLAGCVTIVGCILVTGWSTSNQTVFEMAHDYLARSSLYQNMIDFIFVMLADFPTRRTPSS